MFPIKYYSRLRLKFEIKGMKSISDLVVGLHRILKKSKVAIYASSDGLMRTSPLNPFDIFLEFTNENMAHGLFSLLTRLKIAMGVSLMYQTELGRKSAQADQMRHF